MILNELILTLEVFFNSFLFWVGVVVLKELIFNSFYIWVVVIVDPEGVLILN